MKLDAASLVKTIDNVNRAHFYGEKIPKKDAQNAIDRIVAVSGSVPRQGTSTTSALALPSWISSTATDLLSE